LQDPFIDIEKCQWALTGGEGLQTQWSRRTREPHTDTEWRANGTTWRTVSEPPAGFDQETQMGVASWP